MDDSCPLEGSRATSIGISNRKDFHHFNYERQLCLASGVDADSFCQHGNCANKAQYEEIDDMAASNGYVDASNWL